MFARCNSAVNYENTPQGGDFNSKLLILRLASVLLHEIFRALSLFNVEQAGKSMTDNLVADICGGLNVNPDMESVNFCRGLS